MKFEKHCNRDLKCTSRSTGRRSSHAGHGLIFAGLTPIESLPTLSDSEDTNFRGTVNDVNGSSEIRRVETQKYGARQENDRQGLNGSTVPGAKKPMQVECPYRCAPCQKTFSGKYSLHRHERTVHCKTPMIRCDVCRVLFANPETLHRHKLKLHSASGAPRYPTCGNTFTRRDKLPRHIREMHEGDSQYACKKCNAKFSRHAELATHYANIHAKDTTFSCLVCRQTFPSREMAQRHIQNVHRKKKTHSDRS